MNLDASRLGCRSLLVMMKLGFDMRADYEELLAAPLPERLQALADQIDGYVEWREVPAVQPDSLTFRDLTPVS